MDAVQETAELEKRLMSKRGHLPPGAFVETVSRAYPARQK